MKLIHVFSLFLILSAFTYAQDSDSLFLEGQFVIKYCCMNYEKAIIDLEKIDDSTSVYRLVFNKLRGKNPYNLRREDTITINISLQIQQLYLAYSYRYRTVNLNDEELIVYRHKPETDKIENNVFFMFNYDILPDYHIQKKCPKRLIHKPNLLWMQLYSW